MLSHRTTARRPSSSQTFVRLSVRLISRRARRNRYTRAQSTNRTSHGKEDRWYECFERGDDQTFVCPSSDLGDRACDDPIATTYAVSTGCSAREPHHPAERRDVPEPGAVLDR
jgi:hypothetical protein